MSAELTIAEATYLGVEILVIIFAIIAVYLVVKWERGRRKAKECE